MAGEFTPGFRILKGAYQKVWITVMNQKIGGQNDLTAANPNLGVRMPRSKYPNANTHA